MELRDQRWYVSSPLNLMHRKHPETPSPNLVPTECSNLWLDYYVCVHVKGATTTAPGNPEPTNGGPTPQMPGIVANCKKFHLVASGDSCYDLQTKYSVTLAQLLEWNTEVNDACTNMWGDYYICVGV